MNAISNDTALSFSQKGKKENTYAELDGPICEEAKALITEYRYPSKAESGLCSTLRWKNIHFS